MYRTNRSGLPVVAFFCFLGLTYLPGLILFNFFTERFNSYYIFKGSALPSLLVTSFFFVLMFVAFLFLFSRIPSLSVRKLSKNLVKYSFLFFALLYLLLSLYFFANFDISFRHRNRLSEAGGIVIALFFMRYVALFYLLLCIRDVLLGGELSKIAKLTLLIFIFGWLLAINGSFQVFYLFIGLAVALRPSYLQRISLRKLSSLMLLLPLLLGGVLAIGIGNKVGFDFLFSNEGVDFLSGYIGTVAARSSTSLYSLAYTFNEYPIDFQLFTRLVSDEFFTLSNRFVLLFGGVGFDAEAIQTVSRFNYLEAFVSQADRGGSTPGLLASIYYAGGFLSGFFLIGFYSAVIVNCLMSLFKGIQAYSIFAVLSMCYLIMPFFENPISFVNVIQPPALYLFLLLFLSKIIKRGTFC